MESEPLMDKTLAKENSVDNSISNNSHPTPVKRVLSALVKAIAPGKISACQPKPGRLTPAERSTRLIRLKRTAENLEQVEQSLIRRMGLADRTDRATDKLICQLQIQTNRLLAQLDELIDD